MIFFKLCVCNYGEKCITLYLFSIMQQVKLLIFLPVVMVDLLQKRMLFHLAFDVEIFFWNMAVARGLAHCNLLLHSRFRKDDRML